MKKDRTARKLRLQRETLHSLDAKALELALGGQEPVRTVVLPSDACPVPTSG